MGRTKKRVNYDRLFVIMVERDGFSEDDFENFSKIAIPKLLYTKTKEFKCDNSFYMPKYKKLEQIPDIIIGRRIYDKGVLVKKIMKIFD